MRRLMLVAVAAALVLSGCGREASVRLGDGGAAEGVSGERSMTGDPDDTLGGLEPGYGAEGEDAAATAGDEAAGAPDAPVSSPASPDGAGSSKPSGPASTTPTGSGTSAGGGGSPPNQGIAPGEPHPADPDGCPECTTSITPAEPVEEPRDDSGDGGYTTPRPGQEDVRAREWESAEVADDDVTVTITWWSGVEPCTVLDRVEVDERTDTVTITLYEGNAPGDEGACPMLAVQRQTRVRLSSPLAGRTIVDGARGT